MNDKNITDIDAALQQAKARKAAKDSGTATTATPDGTKVEKAAKPKLSDEEKKARLEARDKERAEKKAVRDAARDAKRAEQAANRQPAHMSKVMKAAEKLGQLDQAAELLFNEATANLTAAELAKLASHIQHFNRVKATERALGSKLQAGQAVEITGGDPRFIGMRGTIDKAQRIRAYVNVPGQNKLVYVFTSDVTAIEAATEASNDSEETETAIEEPAQATG